MPSGWTPDQIRRNETTRGDRGMDSHWVEFPRHLAYSADRSDLNPIGHRNPCSLDGGQRGSSTHIQPSVGCSYIRSACLLYFDRSRQQPGPGKDAAGDVVSCVAIHTHRRNACIDVRPWEPLHARQRACRPSRRLVWSVIMESTVARGTNLIFIRCQRDHESYRSLEMSPSSLPPPKLPPPLLRLKHALRPPTRTATCMDFHCGRWTASLIDLVPPNNNQRNCLLFDSSSTHTHTRARARARTIRSLFQPAVSAIAE